MSRRGSSDLSASRVWTPLRDDYFQPPLLSSRERQYLVRKSCEAAQELVERARSAGGPIAWRHVEKNNGVQIYAGAPRSGTSGAAVSAASMCGVTCVPGTVKEVASLFQLGSNRQMKEFARAHREWFYDGVVLHTLAPRTKEKPLHQVTAKWMVVQTPQGISHRDFCYLECQDKFIDARGRKGWVLGQHSIKLPGCDDLKREFGLVRGSLYHSGFVVVESEDRPGHVDVIHLVQINLKEHTPVPASFLRARVLFVAQVRNMLRSKRLNEQRYLSDLELVPRKYRARCAVCQDSFSLLLLRKLNCRKCGEVVCAACSKEFPIENRNFAATNGGEEVRKLRICMHCFQVITNAPKPTSALVEPPHSSTMSMSFLGYHDDEQRASYMTQRSRRHGHGEAEQAPKIFLQSMRREKPSRRRMSSTSPIPGFGADLPPSTSRRTPANDQYDQLFERSQRYQQQRQDYDRSQHRQVRGSQRMRPSEFRPSQSLSLDDPIARGEGRYTLQMPGPPPAPTPASIFDRPANGGASRRPQIPRSNSSDMLLGAAGNTSNFSRLQELSSRERQEQMMRQGNYFARSSIDRMPDAYMSALQQASRDKHEFAAPPPMYQAPPSDFGAYGATLADHHVLRPDFSSYDTPLDDPSTAPPLDMSALTTSESTIPIELRSSSNAEPSTVHYHQAPASKPVSRNRSREQDRERERERQSTSSDSSASSIDIDTYDDPQPIATAPPIAEQHHHEDNAKPTPNSVPTRSPETLTGTGPSAAYVHDTDEDSEASMGASDEEEESKKPSTTSPQRQPIEDVEETKAQEFAETPALPPPSPSAHAVTRKVLERASIANSLGESPVDDDASAQEEGKADYVNVDELLGRVKPGDEHQTNIREENELIGDLVDHEYQPNEVSSADRELQSTEEDTDVDVVARKYTVVAPNEEDQEEDLVDHEHRSSHPESDGEDFAQRESEMLLNTAGCDMNYLDADMRQFHDQSLFMRPSRDGGAPSLHEKQSFSSQLKDGMSTLSISSSEAPASVMSYRDQEVVPPYERTPTSPNGDAVKPSPIMPSRPAINREGTFALDRMDSEERQVFRNGPVSSAGRVVLDAQISSSTSLSASGGSSKASSVTHTDDRFAVTGTSLVSAPVDDTAEDLTFGGAQQSNGVPPVIPMSVSLSAQGAEEEIVQTSGDRVSEVESRASSKLSFSSVPSSGPRSSSICGSQLDMSTPPATPPTASPAPIGRLSATSASSPVAVASALELAASNEASETLYANGSSKKSDAPTSNSSAPPAYLPDRFRTVEQLQAQQLQENHFDVGVSKQQAVEAAPRESNDSNAALDSFQLDFSASFAAHQDSAPSNGKAVIENLPSLSPTDERNRASSTGSNDVQVRYQPFGSSVLDTVPDSDVLSTSDEDDSEDENMLLSARQLYERFGNTKQLSRLGGDRPGFQRTLSQIQQSFDQLSDSEDEEDTRVPVVAAHRR